LTSSAVGELDPLIVNLKREGYIQVADALSDAKIAPMRGAVAKSVPARRPLRPDTVPVPLRVLHRISVRSSPTWRAGSSKSLRISLRANKFGLRERN